MVGAKKMVENNSSPSPEVVSLKMVGGAYRGGVYQRGWGKIALSTGEIKFVNEENSRGFNAMCDYADQQGWDTANMRKRLEDWVSTGRGCKFGLS
jgi:hypothetical protein